MPAAPESGEVGGKERCFEVFRQFQPQQKAHRAGSLGIAGEVEIQLEGVQHRRQQQHGAAVLLIVGEHLVHQQAQHIGHRHQLEEAQPHQPQRPHGARRVKAVFLVKLGQQRPGAADGSLRHGGEQKQKQRVAHGAALHLTVTAGGVHQIPDGRKAVKAHAQRHQDAAGSAPHAAEGVPVLEKRQNAQRARHAQTQEGGFVLCLQAQTAQPCEGPHPQRGQQEPGGRLRVKHQTGRQQKRILPALRQMQIHRRHNCQKAKKRKALQAQPTHLPIVVSVYYT